jgi:hypothetical protein
MPTCTGHRINNHGNGWTARPATNAGLRTGAFYHAERVAFAALPNSACYLMLIDDFPCHTCHAYFLAQSLAGHSIIFKVTHNAGAYSADHGLGQTTSLPCIIYYHAGTVRYDSAGMRMAGNPNLGPHPAFPAHPDFTNI